MSLTVLILAAGQGKRMNSALPKVLQPLAGRPLLGHVLACARELQAAGIHVVYGHGGEAVPAAFKEVPVRWVLQAEQLGTGHAALQALAVAGQGAIPDDDRVLVLYGDVPLIRRETLARLLALAEGEAVGVLSVVLENPTGYGRMVRDPAGRVARIVEEKDATAAERAIREVNTGIMVLPAGRLRRWLGALRNDNAQGEYYLTDVIASAVAEGVVAQALVAPTADEVLGINDKIQLAEAETAHRRREAEALMRAGATVVDPARLDVRGEVSVGRDVYLDVNVVLVGRVKLGDGVRIGPNCYLRDCEIGAGSEVFAHCVVEEVVTGADCRVGPFARLRPGTALAEAVHIGNFVEVKNSRLGKGSKANHLTYLGDSEIGSGVNVGAGTVTCNYDGANKSSTQIGDGAFIGSGSMLVAPVRIGANATIGAGSTITRDAPADKLTLARGRQTTVEGWKRPVKGRKPKR